MSLIYHSWYGYDDDSLSQSARHGQLKTIGHFIAAHFTPQRVIILLRSRSPCTLLRWTETGHWQWNLPLVVSRVVVFLWFVCMIRQSRGRGDLYIATPTNNPIIISISDIHHSLISLSCYFSPLISDSTKTPPEQQPFTGNSTMRILWQILIFNWLIWHSRLIPTTDRGTLPRLDSTRRGRFACQLWSSSGAQMFKWPIIKVTLFAAAALLVSSLKVCMRKACKWRCWLPGGAIYSAALV